MKQALLVGCGVVLLALVALFGFAGWVYWTPVNEFLDQMEAASPRFAALDEAHPFDPEADEGQDPQRFATHLELRARLNEILLRLDTEAVARQQDEDQPLWQRLRAPLEVFSETLPAIVEAFEQHGMGPAEFRHQSRLLWAALRALDKGGGPPALADLRDRYSHLRNLYEEFVREKGQEDAPTLDDIIGHESSWPPRAVDGALDTLAENVERAHAALLPPELEALSMQFEPSDPEAMGGLVIPIQAGAPPPGR